jgi:hypothetical protein
MRSQARAWERDLDSPRPLVTRLLPGNASPEALPLVGAKEKVSNFGLYLS